MSKSKPFVISKGCGDKTVGFGRRKSELLSALAKDDNAFFVQIKELYYIKYDKIKQKYYDSLYKKFVTNNGLHCANHFSDKVAEVVSLMKDRKTSTEIMNLFSDKYDLNKNTIHSIIGDANTIIRQEFELEKSFLLDLHLLRYEEIFLENLNVDLDEVPAGYKKALKCEHLITAMDTLFQKERLLGIHTKNFKLKVTQNQIQESNTEFDITILSVNERLETISLLNRAKTVEEYIRPSVPNNNPMNIDTKNNKIVDDNMESPIKQAKQTDIIGDERSIEITSSGKNLDEVKEALGNTLKNKVQELFNKKKGI
jgi:hypothetical protein